jgi:hypothetical protein
VNQPARTENATLYAILLLIGGTAAAASFTHVHDVTVAHGQPDWIGWANATVLELISIAVGLEIRRRRNTGLPAGRFTGTTLGIAVVLSLAAQVAEAEHSVWGWIVAALPAAAFLALVKIVLSRPVTVAETSPDVQDAKDEPATVAPAEPARQPVAVRYEDDPSRDVRDLAPPIPDELLTAAQQVADQHQRHTGRPITRDTLRSELRVSNATAGDLLRLLRDSQTRTVLTAPARINHHPAPS